ncbi:MAG: type II secretion system protein [Candidatus Omnitrophota bacterium]|nr:type II secretion system GspH family protein [Candidatus Omnitrophota bacterium]
MGKKPGFTLIETIVVMTIFSIIAVGIASSFTAGMKIWGRARGVDFVQGETLFNLERIASQLRQSVNISAVGFGGTKDEFFFPAVLANSIGRVTYKFDSSSNRVLLRFQKLEDILFAKEEEIEAADVEYTERKFSSADSFYVSYFYWDEEQDSYGWVDEWDQELGIFSALKLEVEVGDNKFVKTVFIPVSSKKIAEESREETIEPQDQE